MRQWTDATYAVLLSERLLHHRSFDLRAHVTTADPLPYQLERAGGRVHYRYPPGTSVLSLPLVAAFNVAGVSAIDAAGSWDRRGERIIQAGLAAGLMAAFAVVVLWTARVVLPEAWSLAITGAVVLGSPVWSTASRALWSHTWAIVLIAGAVCFLVRGAAGAAARPVVLAALLGGAFATRPLAVIPLVAVGVYLWRTDRGAARTYLAAAIVTVAAFVAWSLAVLGRPLPAYYVPGGAAGAFDLASLGTGLAGVLASPSRGLLVFVPSVAFAAYLLARYHATLPLRGLAGLAMACVGAHTLVIASWGMWWGGHAYGPRLMTDVMPWLALLGIAGTRAMRDAPPPRAGRRRLEVAAGALLVAASVAANAPGALVRATFTWNAEPDVDRHPERLWDWRRPQMLAGLVPPAAPREGRRPPLTP